MTFVHIKMSQILSLKKVISEGLDPESVLSDDLSDWMVAVGSVCSVIYVASVLDSQFCV